MLILPFLALNIINLSTHAKFQQEDPEPKPFKPESFGRRCRNLDLPPKHCGPKPSSPKAVMNFSRNLESRRCVSGQKSETLNLQHT